jgi:hypothetical protein
MRGKLALTLCVAVSLSMLGMLAQSHAAVTPATFDVTLKPGESAQITEVVDVPEIPPRLDVALLVDNTGSYFEDLPIMKGLAPGIFDRVRAGAGFSRFALATHVDFPFPTWGVSGEYAYRLEQQLTPDRATWLAAVNAMRTLYGYDGPESQLPALFQATTGAGIEMPTTTDGDYNDPGEIAPGSQITFRDHAVHVIAFTTDAPFHLPGDPGGPFPYPGPSIDQVVDAMKLLKIRAIAIKAPGSTTQMDQVAAATGGSVVTTGSSSAEIGDAILAGLEDLKVDVVPQLFPDAGACEPLDVFFDPAKHTGVSGGTTVNFQQTVSLPSDVTAADVPADGIITCQIKFKASEVLLGTETLTVKVILNQEPDCSAVTATPATITPPDHGFTLVTLSGATDADGDPVSLTIGDVTQDEPLDHVGDGATSPDARAGSQPHTIQLRAERSGTGDGRVYRINFEASDGRGGTCTGSVDVGVPRTQGSGGTAVDSGQDTSSFGPSP